MTNVAEHSPAESDSDGRAEAEGVSPEQRELGKQQFSTKVQRKPGFLFFHSGFLLFSE